MNNVWQLSQEIARIEELIELQAEANEGEVSDELIRAFDELALRFDSEQVAQLIRKLKAEKAMYKDQERRFRGEVERKDKAIKNLQLAVMRIMDAKGIKKEGSLSVCKNGGKTPMEITDLVPEDFTIFEPRPNTDLIRERLESGDQLPFAKLGERGRHLRTKAT